MAQGNARGILIAGSVGLSGGISNLGNTAGTSGTVASHLLFVGSNNITLSQSVNGSSATISIIGGAGGGGGVAISGGTQLATSGTVNWANSNGISFGLSGSTQMTASYTVPSTVGLISAVNFSAGTTSNNSASIQFANSNGVSFGLNAGTITATVATNYLTSQSNQALSGSNGSFTFQTATFGNLNGASFYTSNGSLVASYTVPSTAGLLSAVNLSAGTTSNNLSAFTLSNSNNVSFGLNGSVITATVTTPAQTNQTLGLYATSNTTGQSSSSTVDARSLTVRGAGIISVGYSAGELLISASAAGAADGVNIIAAGTQTANTTGSVMFSNSNGISFGMSNSSIVTASYTVPNTAGLISAVNFSAGTTSNNSASIRFQDSNGVSFGLNAGTITATVATNYLTSQSNQALSGSNGSFTFQTATFGNLNGLSLYTSNGSIVGSYTVPSVPAQTAQTLGLYAVSNTTGQSSSTTIDARTLSFHGAGIASVGYSGGSVVISVPSGGGAAVSVSDAASSGTIGRLAFTNLNGVTLSLSTGAGGSHTIVGSHNALTSQSNQAFSASGGSSAFQTLNFVNGNGATFTNNAGSVGISYTVPNVPAQTAQTIGVYAVSNTTGASSSSTVDARSLSFQGAGIISVGMTNGSVIISASAAGAGDGVNILAAGTQTANTTGTVLFSNLNGVSFGMNNSSVITASVAAGGGGGVAISAGTTQATSGTVVFSNSNVRFGVNGQTVTAQLPGMSYFEPYQWLTGQQLALGTLFLHPIYVPAPIAATRGELLLHISNSTNAGGTISYSMGLYTYSGSTASLVSSSSSLVRFNSTAGAGSSSSYSNVSGTRYHSVELGTWDISAGNYLQAIWMNSSSSGTSGTVSVFGKTAGSINPYPYDTATTMGSFPYWGIGVYSGTFTTAMPGSIHLSVLRQTGATVARQPWFRYMGTA